MHIAAVMITIPCSPRSEDAFDLNCLGYVRERLYSMLHTKGAEEGMEEGGRGTGPVQRESIRYLADALVPLELGGLRESWEEVHK